MFSLFKDVQGVLAFQDDILIFAKDIREHNCILDNVLKILSNHGMTVSKDKCKFLTDNVEYLDHHITAQGIKPKEDLLRP